MAADIEVEIVFVALIAEQGVGAADGFAIHERFKALKFRFLVGQSPGVEVEVEFVSGR